MRARLISTDGEHIEAGIETGDPVLHVMDEFSPAGCGEFLQIDLAPMLDEAECDNEILDANPDRKQKLEDAFDATGDGIGQPVAFTITRLSARLRPQKPPYSFDNVTRIEDDHNA